MTSSFEQAEAAAALVGVLAVFGPLLWLTSNIGDVSLNAAIDVMFEIVLTVAMPAFGTIAFFYVIFKGLAMANG